MSESEFNELRELSWRRPLSAVEEARLQAYLSAHPDEQRAWDEESALSHALGQVPNVTLSSNFTAQVLQAVERAAVPTRRWQWLQWLPMPRLVGATVAAALLSFSVVGYRLYHEREQQREVSSLVLTIPEPDVFADFDTIQKLGPLPSMDEELWVALNQ